jgi:hypothetical protein
MLGSNIKFNFPPNVEKNYLNIRTIIYIFLCHLVHHKIFFKKAAATIGQMSILPKTIGQESFRSIDVFRAVAGAWLC